MPPAARAADRCRRRGVTKPKTWAALQREKIARAVGWYDPPTDCCKQRCGTLIPAQRSRHLRRAFNEGETQVHRKALLIALVADPNALDEQEGGRGRAVFELQGVIVCRAYMMGVTTASQGLLSSVLGTLRAPSSALANRPSRTVSGSMREAVAAYLRGAKSRDSDSSPDRSTFRLPQRNKRDVYQDYIEHEKSVGREPCTYAYFVRAWAEAAPDIKTKRLHGFSRCDECVES